MGDGVVVCTYCGDSIRYPITSPTSGQEVATRHASQCRALAPRLGDRHARLHGRICPECDHAGFHARDCPLHEDSHGVPKA